MLEMIDCGDILNCFLDRFPDLSLEDLPSGTRVVQMPAILRNDLLSGMVMSVSSEGMPECQRYSYGDIMSHLSANAVEGMDREVRNFIRDCVLDDNARSHLESLLLPDFSVFVDSAWVQNDLLGMLWTRKFCGRSNITIEKIVQIYTCGCFPVGWYGCYPDDINFLVVPHENW
jgi:hypothetical protein